MIFWYGWLFFIVLMNKKRAEKGIFAVNTVNYNSTVMHIVMIMNLFDVKSKINKSWHKNVFICSRMPHMHSNSTYFFCWPSRRQLQCLAPEHVESSRWGINLLFSSVWNFLSNKICERAAAVKPASSLSSRWTPFSAKRISISVFNLISWRTGL